jgi:hypothetical protein
LRLSQRSILALTTLAATASLGLSLLQPVASAAPRATTAGTTTPERQAAANALDAVESALAHASQAPGHAQGPAQGKPGRDLTLLLTQLASHLDDLGPADRRTANRILARPTNGGDDLGDLVVRYPNSAPVRSNCSTDVCINWIESTADAPALTDTNSNNIPDYIDTMRGEMQHVWDVEVGDFGYKAPLADGGNAAGEGPNNRLDVYVADIGDKGYYGYCTPERNVGAGWAASGYCVLDDDYAEFDQTGNTPLQSLQVTAAHEFFHAVQFGYDFGEDGWFMEGTAAWMEDEVYDSVDDNYQYLRSSPLSNPNRPLDHSASIGVYGSWIWWRFLSEWFGDPTVVRSIWERADDSAANNHGHYSMKEVDAEIASRGTSLARAFSLFGAVNRAPQTFYEEGAAYRNVQKTPAAKSFTLTRTTRSSGARSLTLNHMTNGTIAVKPGNGIKPAWTLKVAVDGPARSHQPFVTVASYAGNGDQLDAWKVRLNRRGVGSIRVPFGSVARIDVTLTNAGHAYRCGQRTQYSCEGKPQDDNQVFGYNVTAARP